MCALTDSIHSLRGQFVSHIVNATKLKLLDAFSVLMQKHFDSFLCVTLREKPSQFHGGDMLKTQAANDIFVFPQPV